MKIKVWLGLGSYIVLYVSKMSLAFSVGDDIFSSNPWLYELLINTRLPQIQFVENFLYSCNYKDIVHQAIGILQRHVVAGEDIFSFTTFNLISCKVFAIWNIYLQEVPVPFPRSIFHA